MDTYTKYVEMVKGPGKFEGEPPYVPYFWDLGLEGFEDDIQHGEDGILYSTFYVTKEERDLWGDLLEGIKSVCVWEDDNGFVYHSVNEELFG